MLQRLWQSSFLVGLTVLASQTVQAEIDNQLFTSSAHRIKLTVPKGWRPSEQPSYPGVALWLLRSQPEGRIVVGSEPLRQELFCSWPKECRTKPESLAARYACALRASLGQKDLLFGADQAGPKENAAGGIPSVWFEFTDGKRYVRQAIAANQRRVFTLVLSTGSASDRATHSRAFEQALRSLRELTEQEAQSEAQPEGTGSTSSDAPAIATSTPGSAENPAGNPAPTQSPSPPSSSPPTSAAGAVVLDLPLFNPACPCPVDPACPCPADPKRPCAAKSAKPAAP